MVNEYRSKYGDALWLGSKGRYGSFHLYINVWVAGKLCDPSLTRAISECFRDEYHTHYTALYKCLGYLSYYYCYCYFYCYCYDYYHYCYCCLSSVLWRCWLGGRKGIRPVKTEWRGTGMVICLDWGANDLHMVQLMSLPPRHLLLQ